MSLLGCHWRNILGTMDDSDGDERGGTWRSMVSMLGECRNVRLLRLGLHTRRRRRTHRTAARRSTTCACTCIIINSPSLSPGNTDQLAVPRCAVCAACTEYSTYSMYVIVRFIWIRYEPMSEMRRAGTVVHSNYTSRWCGRPPTPPPPPLQDVSLPSCPWAAGRVSEAKRASTVCQAAGMAAARVPSARERERSVHSHLPLQILPVLPLTLSFSFSLSLLP